MGNGGAPPDRVRHIHTKCRCGPLLAPRIEVYCFNYYDVVNNINTKLLSIHATSYWFLRGTTNDIATLWSRPHAMRSGFLRWEDSLGYLLVSCSMQGNQKGLRDGDIDLSARHLTIVVEGVSQCRWGR